MSVHAVNVLNAWLMIAACVAAFALPFHLFLAAYAVLGPLHYLTQISWLHDRGYFARRRRTDALLLLALTVLAVVGPWLTSAPDGQRSGPVVCVAFAGAVAMAFTSSLLARIVVAAAGIVAVAGQLAVSTLVLVGFLLGTVIHVFVFTALFILLGAVKSRSASGFASFAVLLGCTAACFLVNPGNGLEPGSTIIPAYAPFALLNAHLAALLGWGPLRTVDDVFRSTAGVAVMRFIAFAYTYHYLNWFSKTKVIGWHEIPRWRAVGIVVLWVGVVSLYAIDYRLGVATLVGLSLLHVMLEFPLDHTAFVDLGRQVAAAGRQALAAVPATSPSVSLSVRRDQGSRPPRSRRRR